MYACVFIIKQCVNEVSFLIFNKEIRRYSEKEQRRMEEIKRMRFT